MELLPEVTALKGEELLGYIHKRAVLIVENTQGDSWDDPEEWSMDAAELAHAVVRLLLLINEQEKAK